MTCCLIVMFAGSFLTSPPHPPLSFPWFHACFSVGVFCVSAERRSEGEDGEEGVREKQNEGNVEEVNEREG